MSLHSMTWSPTRRYSAVAVFSQDLERVVLIHKLKPAWQAGKANFPGGKVEDQDWADVRTADGVRRACDAPVAYRRCAARELQEETDLVVDASSLTLFCTLRFRSREGDDAECQFFCCRGDVEAARTIEQERVFIDASDSIQQGYDAIYDTFRNEDSTKTAPTQTKECPYLAACINIPSMSNLPWLTAMAKQMLRGDGSDSTPPFVVYEAGTLS